jgi:hypothetical protein
MRVAKGFLLLGMAFLAANVAAAPSPVKTPAATISDSSVSIILAGRGDHRPAQPP